MWALTFRKSEVLKEIKAILLRQEIKASQQKTNHQVHIFLSMAQDEAGSNTEYTHPRKWWEVTNFHS
jgi:hypothetical protein